MSVAVLAGVILTARDVERCAVCYDYHLWFVENETGGGRVLWWVWRHLWPKRIEPGLHQHVSLNSALCRKDKGTN